MVQGSAEHRVPGSKGLVEWYDYNGEWSNVWADVCSDRFATLMNVANCCVDSVASG